MAKSARASSRKANNQRLKKNVFGPIEAARAERLSAKLLELASKPKETPAKEVEMEDVTVEGAAQGQKKSVADEDQSMDIDSGATKKASGKGKRVEKRRSKRKSSIVFPSYKERQLRKKK